MLIENLKTVMVEVVLGCNLGCKHCPVPTFEQRLFGSRQRGTMSLTTFEKILLQLPPACQIHLGVMGEPLLNPDIAEMSEMSSLVGHPTFLTSNATMLSGTLALKLKNTLDLMVLSIDGWGSSYEKMRPGSTWNTVHDNAVSFLKLPGRCSVNIAQIDSALTLEDNMNSKTYWENLGAKVFRLPLDDYCGQLKMPEYLGFLGGMRKHDKQRTPCELIQRCMHVTIEGRAFPCCHDLSTSSIFARGIDDEGGLRAAWEEDFEVLRDRHRLGNFPFPCSSCSLTMERGKT